MINKNFVTDDREFSRYWVDLQACFQLENRLPDQVFTSAYIPVGFTQFERIPSDEFLSVIEHLSRISQERSLTLAVVDPDAKEYFWRHFQYYGLARFSGTGGKDELLDTLTFAPPESPADALIYNGNVFALAAGDGAWLVWAERDLGLAVLAIRKELTTKLHGQLPAVVQWFSLDEVIADVIAPNFVSGKVPPELEYELRANYAEAILPRH